MKINKKSMAEYLVFTIIFLLLLILAVILIGNTKKDPVSMINETYSFDDDLELDLDIFNSEITNIYELEDFLDEDNNNDYIRLNLVSDSKPYLNNLIISDNLINSKFNFSLMNDFISYFNYENIDYNKINQIEINEFYNVYNLEDTIFVCNLLINKENIQQLKLNNFYQKLVEGKISDNFLKLLVNLLDEEKIVDLYDTKNSLEKINNKYSEFYSVNILDSDFSTEENDNFKRLYLVNYDDFLKENKKLFLKINTILEEKDIKLYDKQIYQLSSMFYIFPCLLFNNNNIYIYKGHGEYYFINESVENPENIRDIIEVGSNDIEINKYYSNFLYYDSITFYKKEYSENIIT